MDLTDLMTRLKAAVTAPKNRKKLIVAGVILLFLLFMAMQPASARPLMTASAGSETITLHDTKGECPSGQTQDGRKWSAKVATYVDTKDGERQSGCYVIDEQSDPKLVIVIFKQGAYAGRPLYIPARMFKPEV